MANTRSTSENPIKTLILVALETQLLLPSTVVQGFHSGVDTAEIDQ